MSEEKAESKPLTHSKSFWGSTGLAVLALSGVDWGQVVSFLEQLVVGAVPGPWVPVVHAVAALALALLAVFGISKRKTVIKGLF